MQNFQFQWKGWKIGADRERLFIGREGIRLAEFGAAPLVEGQPTSIGPWQKVGNLHFAAELDIGGSVHVAVEHGHTCYWMETDRKQFDRLTYFPDSRFKGRHWQTYLSDEHDRLWDVDVDAEVLISSSYPGMNVDGEDGAGMTDPGDMPPTWIWNIPVRACSLLTGGGWLGLSIPGPLPVGVTRLKMKDRHFSITFQVLRPSCREGAMPRVFFVPGLSDAYAALDAHREISKSTGLMRPRSSVHPTWWSAPSFKCADEVYRQNLGWFRYDEQGRQTTALTTENWLSWIKQVRESIGNPEEMTVQLDQIFFYRYGSRQVISELGGVQGLRRTIDQLRKQGIRTGLYIHLYMVDKTVPFYRERPEAFCRPKDPNFKLVHGVTIGKEPELAYIDWTHPKGREFMLDHIEFLISDKPGCLNADWLLVNNNLAPDPRKFDFYDPDWGIGDLMQMKVQRLVYEKVKSIKPDALVRRQSPADCYMQPYLDHANCCEHWKGDTADWYRRGQIITRTMSDVIFTTDAWFVTLTKAYEYYMAMLVWIVPEIESVTHAPHPYWPSWRPLREKDYRRRRAGIKVYLNAPVNITDRCRVTWHPDGRLEAWRKYTHGPLKDFYAALAISRRCFVTYNEHQALVASTETRHALIPLPPKAALIKVEKVTHKGEVLPYDFDLVHTEEGTFVDMRVEDCGGEAMCFRISYRLG